MNTNKALETVGNIYFKALVRLLLFSYFKRNDESSTREQDSIFQKPSLSEHPANELGIGMDKYVKNKHLVFV